jgi:hypothetical protein
MSWLFASGCVEWRSDVTLRGVRHWRVLLASPAAVACTRACGERPKHTVDDVPAVDAYARCLGGCGGAENRPGRCPPDGDPLLYACGEFRGTWLTRRDGRCREQTTGRQGAPGDVADEEIAACVELRAPTSLGILGAIALGIVVIVLSFAARAG